MQKLIIDTNVLVSSLLGKSYPHKIVFDVILNGKVIFFTSQDILREYSGVLSRKKFQVHTYFSEEVKGLLESIEELSISIVPRTSHKILHDPSDNKFLDLASTCKADFLVTGNLKHFPFPQFEKTQILSPKEYWDRYWK
ncbi:MAG: putative toxin-antitoxin system toxin component, PIN family [Bacteroidetes bacterium]|nr:putative toxin-antitoxin system toxin component, PIN family [Bacteroidota bacterium]